MKTSTRRRRGSRKYGKTQRRLRSRRGLHSRGGALGRIPGMATVSIQQDPYSARVLVDTETAEDLFEARGPYLL